MAQQLIGLGGVPNDGTGDNLLTMGGKVNANFTELYAGIVGLLKFKGSTNASGNPNYPAAIKGDAYIISTAGKIGGASGVSVDVGDVYVASADNAGGTQAAVGASWFVLEHNLVGALLSANNLSDLASASTARANLGLYAAQSGVSVAHTGTTAETVIATIAMPAMGVNDGWRQELSFECTGSTNSKIFRVRLGNISGPSVLAYTTTTATVIRVADMRSVYNKGATSSQTVTQAGGSLGYNTSTGANNDTTFDTSAPFNIVITAQLGLSTETITLKSYRFEMLRG